MAVYLWTTIAGVRTGGGYNDGPAATSLFNVPTGVAVYASGTTYVYVADSVNNTIRRITIASGTTVDTLAGQTGVTGSADGGPGVATFNTPTGVAADASGNLYVADFGNDTIRKITFSGTVGTVSTVAGAGGAAGSIDGSGVSARFYGPTGVALDAAGNVYVADSGNHVIREITPGGTVTTFAGFPGQSGTNDGVGSAARFFSPHGVNVDSTGNVWVADSGNHTIRKITTQQYVSTVAGTPGQMGSTDGSVSVAQFDFPTAVVSDTTGTVYVADYGNDTVRVIASGTVSTLAGTAGVPGATGALLNQPAGLALNNGLIYDADSGSDTIRLIGTTGTGIVSTFAGNAAASGSADGVASSATFNHPTGVALDGSGDELIADANNDTIRMVTAGGTVVTIAGVPGVTGTANGTGSAALFNQPMGICSAGGTGFFIADSGNYTIRSMSLSGTVATVTTLAGTAGVSGTADGVGGAAQFAYPTGVATDGTGNVYVADFADDAVRWIQVSSSTVTTVAGGVGQGIFNQPTGVACDNEGNFYVADSGNNEVWEGSLSGSSATYFPIASGFFYPEGLAVDGNLNVYVADTRNSVIQEIDPSGDVFIIGGIEGVFGDTDSVGATQATFYAPGGVAVDSSTFANVYVADTGNNRIMKGVPWPEIDVTTESDATVTSTSNITFGVLPVRVGAPQTFTVTNDGDSNLTNLTVATTGSEAGDFTVLPPSSNSVAPGDSVTFGVTFDPSVPGPRSASLVVNSNDPLTPSLVATVSGTGATSGQPVFTLQQGSSGQLATPASVNFGDSTVGAGLPLTFTVGDEGLGNLSILSFNMTGPNASDFAVHQPNSLTIGAGDTTTFTVTFTPGQAGPRQATLHMTSTDPETPSFFINLTGTGLSYSGATGVYAGLLDYNGGYITLTLQSNGIFTGKLVMNGTTSALLGQLSAGGDYEGAQGVFAIELKLHIDLSGAANNPNGPTITGVVGGSEAFTAYQAVGSKVLSAETVPILLGSVDPLASVPQGTGYCVAKILTSGMASVSGAFADGTKFTASGPMTGGVNDRQLILYSAGKDYTVSGPLSFSSVLSGTQTQPICAGSLFWVRTAYAKALSYPSGFTTGLAAEGAAVLKGTKFTLTPGSAVLTDGTGGTVTATVKTGSVGATGVFTGSFSLTESGKVKKISVAGAVDPYDMVTGLPRAAGYFLAPYISGTTTGAIYSGSIGMPAAK